MNRKQPPITLEHLKSRTDEVGQCWIWNSTTSSNGYPIIKPYGCRCELARRLAFTLAGGTLNPREPVAVKCDEKLCINPDHLEKSTVSKIGKNAAKRGGWKSKTRGAKIANAKRKTGKLSMDIAKEIRYSAETLVVVAERFKINVSWAKKIRNGSAWKEYTPNAFTGLGARA